MDGPHRRAFLASLGAVAALGMLPRHAVAQRAGVAALTDAYNASGQQLFKAFAAASGNIVFSPYSIGTALAMALAGARAETEREMATALKHRLARMEIADANAGALAILNGYGKSADPARCLGDMQLKGDRCEAQLPADGNCRPPTRQEGALCVVPAILPPSAKLLIANALMRTGSGAVVSKDYTALLQEKYSAEIFNNAGLAEVNGWVERKTEGKIDKILEQLDPNAVAVILNAAYFKAAWASTFSKPATRNEAFNLSPGQQVEVPMMHKVAAYSVAARAGYRAIRLPYAIRAIGMVVVIPEAIDGLAAVTARLGGQELPELFAALRTAPGKSVDLALPRFKSAFKANLVPPLQQAGMRVAFDLGRADFSGITGRPAAEIPLAIDQVVHRATIDVHEDGSEAAAATAISIVRTSAALSPESFRVDRPFLFYIVDDATGAILFQGRVVDPR